jgi:hypothetical protein
MCDQTPPKSRDDTLDHLRRAAERWRDLSDPEFMAKAWDEPATPDVQPVTNSPRRFGRLADNFDDPLPDAEVTAWERDSFALFRSGRSR